MDKQLFLDKVTRNNPSFLEKYNYDLLPATFKGTDKIAIECNSHGVFSQSAYTHLYGAGCVKCGFEKSAIDRNLGTDGFIRKSKQKFGEKFDYSKTVYVKKGVELTITCPRHGDIRTTPEWHTWSKHGCRECDIEIPREFKKAKVLEKAREVHNGRYDYSKVVFTKVDAPVEITCPSHGAFFQNLFRHANHGDMCPKCVIENGRITTDEFLERSRKIHGNRYDYSKVVFKNVSDKVTITCKKHGEFVQRIASHLSGNRCRDCYIEDSWLDREQFIDSSKKIHGDNYDYSKVVYKGSKKKVEIVCPRHGPFWQKPNAHLSSESGCRFCYESKGERAVESVLKKYGLKYIREYRIEPYLFRYDFYLPENDIFIEFNGIQHYRPVEIFGGRTAFNRVCENDSRKKLLVKTRGSSLIVVSYMSLCERLVEEHLIKKLKFLYKYWFVVDGRVVAFKRELELYEAFQINKTLRVNDLVSEILRRNDNVKTLF